MSWLALEEKRSNWGILKGVNGKKRDLGPYLVASHEGKLYKKHHDKKSLSKRLLADGAYLFSSKIGSVAAFYSPDHATSLLLDDIKSRSAELNALVASLPLEKRSNLLHEEAVEECRHLLAKEGIRVSRAKIAEGLYGGKGYAVASSSGLLASYSYILSGLRLPINRPEDLLAGRFLANNGLGFASLSALKDRSALDEVYSVLKKDKLDPFAKIALIHFFYLHSGLYSGGDERFLYLLLTVLIADSYGAPFGYTLSRRLSRNEKRIASFYKSMLVDSARGDLDRFVYRYEGMLSSFLDQEILALRRSYRSVSRQ